MLDFHDFEIKMLDFDDFGASMLFDDLDQDAGILIFEESCKILHDS